MKEKEHKKEPEPKETPEKKKIPKLLKFIILAVIIGFFYYFLKDPLIALAKTIPWLWAFIEHMTEHIGNKTYLGLFYLTFFGGMFFIVLPVEGVFLLYLADGKEFFFVIPIVIIGYLGGLFVDYVIGFVLGEWVAKKIFKDKFHEKKEKIDKSGGIMLFFSNIFPLPLQWISVFYGAMRYKLKNFLIICLIGQTIKYNALYIGVEYLKPYYEPLWEVVKNTFTNFYDVIKSLFQ